MKLDQSQSKAFSFIPDTRTKGKIRHNLLYKGCIVTINPMRFQNQIAKKVINKNVSYKLAFKGNYVDLYNSSLTVDL